MKRRSIFAVFQTRSHAKAAVAALVGSGFPAESVFLFAHNDPEFLDANDLPSVQPLRINLGIEVGVVVGIVVGATTAFLVGTMSTQFQVLASSIGLVSLTGLGALFGLFFGAFSGALIGIGTPAHIHERYNRYLKDGAILFCADAKSDLQTSFIIERLEKNGGFEIWTTERPRYLSYVRTKFARA